MGSLAPAVSSRDPVRMIRARSKQTAPGAGLQQRSGAMQKSGGSRDAWRAPPEAEQAHQRRTSAPVELAGFNFSGNTLPARRLPTRSTSDVQSPWCRRVSRQPASSALDDRRRAPFCDIRPLVFMRSVGGGAEKNANCTDFLPADQVGPGLKADFNAIVPFPRNPICR